jgi:hypothetical protein
MPENAGWLGWWAMRCEFESDLKTDREVGKSLDNPVVGPLGSE